MTETTVADGPYRRALVHLDAETTCSYRAILRKGLTLVPTKCAVRATRLVFDGTALCPVHANSSRWSDAVMVDLSGKLASWRDR